MAHKLLASVFEEVGSTRGKHKRVEKLRELSNPFIKTLLDYTFNPHIQWMLPEGYPPFTPCEEVESSLTTRLYQEMRRLPIFLNTGPYPHMKPMRREQLFIELLSNIHPEDAKLIGHIKDKKLPQDKITAELVAEAFPDLATKWQ